MSLSCLARKIFFSALEAVKPEKLIANVLHRDGDLLVVNGTKYVMKSNVFVVGFGKAVYGMAAGVEKILNDHIVGGYLSVPYGLTFPVGSTGLGANSKIKVVPGAENNLPDTAAVNNSINIKTMIDSLAPDDIALILISGGGSALLPLPVPQISLAEKLESIKVVANAGGSIQQLNTIRKKLSQLKGGGLLSSCPSKHVVSLIISDIVGDPLDLIASGPTVRDMSTANDCLEIISKLNVDKKIPVNVLEYLRSLHTDDIRSNEIKNDNTSQCNNFVVGSNRILVDRVSSMAEEHGYMPLVITTTLEGDAEEVGANLAEIASILLASNNREKLMTSLLRLAENCVDENNIDTYLKADKICLISAGETTVHVKGSGRGGRNQHLILSAMNHFRKMVLSGSHLDFNKLCLLSGGTDGQDGATDVAGALCDGPAITKSIELGLDLDSFLSNCGSYDFFSAHESLECLIKTGLTGTNVMDIQILLIDKGLA